MQTRTYARSCRHSTDSIPNKRKKSRFCRNGDYIESDFNETDLAHLAIRYYVIPMKIPTQAKILQKQPIDFTDIQTLLCVKLIPGRPVPHADVLDELLSKFLGVSYSNSALFDFILGDASPGRNTSGDNLDISILDVDTVRKIVDFAKQKHKKDIIEFKKTRRMDTRRHQLHWWDTYVVNSSFHLMKQTIYMTKERVNLTRPWRKKYGDHFAYKIAILYGASAAILSKMEALLAQLTFFEKKTHFLWFLIIYEKMLACNIDISDSIEKLFIIQGEYEQKRGAKPKDYSKQNITLTDAEKQAIKNNPELYDEIIAQKYVDEKVEKGAIQ